MPQLRRMNRLHERHAGKGLHMIGAFTQFQALDDIEKHITDMGIKFPVAMDGFWDTELSAPLLCHIFVIGVDGKLVDISVNGWEAAALEELKKVKYPGLGLADVHEAAEPAAKAFGEGRMGEAHSLANKVTEGDYELEVLEQADKIIDRVRERMSSLESRARMAEIMGDYDLALACLHELATRFDGVDEFSDAKERAAALQERDDVKAERKARRAFLALRIDIFGQVSGAGSDDAARVKALQLNITRLKEFAEEHSDRVVASTAKDLQAAYEAWARALQAKPEGEE
jgi:hypothetical protein